MSKIKTVNILVIVALVVIIGVFIFTVSKKQTVNLTTGEIDNTFKLGHLLVKKAA